MPQLDDLPSMASCVCRGLPVLVTGRKKLPMELDLLCFIGSLSPLSVVGTGSGLSSAARILWTCVNFPCLITYRDPKGETHRNDHVLPRFGLAWHR